MTISDDWLDSLSIKDQCETFDDAMFNAESFLDFAAKIYGRITAAKEVGMLKDTEAMHVRRGLRTYQEIRQYARPKTPTARPE